MSADTISVWTGRQPDARSERAPFRRVAKRAIARLGAGPALATVVIVACGQSGAGHQISHYPSYYPDQIRIEALDPLAAGKALGDASVHAYVGAPPDFAAAPPAHVKAARSLESILVLSFNTASARLWSAERRCTTARDILARLRDEPAAGFVVHPYPVTPYHADYLHHVDLIEAAKATLVSAPAAGIVPRVGARGRLAETIVQARLAPAADDADAVLEAVPLDGLLAGSSSGAWLGAPLGKEGWFQAHRLLAAGLPQARRDGVDQDYDRLVHGDTQGLAERATLERRLVTALSIGCERVVAGYAVRDEFFNDVYPAGIENIAHDSLGGLNVPLFLRTAKLKDYPWNGQLHLAVRDPPQSAWNPVGGFTDPMGRLLWSAVGDPAMIAIPFNASWMPNRVQPEVTKIEGQSGGIRVPADAVLPRPGGGVLEPVGERAYGSAKVLYEVLASPFEDGTEMTMADALYPFAFLFRWGVEGDTASAHEPRVKESLAAIREQLVGIRPVRVDAATHAVAEGMNVVWKTLVIEVYLRGAAGDERQVAALAAPWSTVPWHLLTLMEEAVARGYAAFSHEEAVRRGTSWLDLVRDPDLRAKLQDLVAHFEQEGFRPGPLNSLVTADEARERWRSLRVFAERQGHFLVANGPYRLKTWDTWSVALEAVREMSYPLGFGTFDRFVDPPKAVIEAATREGNEITVRVNAEMTLKAGRGYQLVNEPLTRTTARGVQPVLVVSRFLLLDQDGKVLMLDKMDWRDDGGFTVKLPERLPPGRYKALVSIFLDGNALQPSWRILEFRVGTAERG